jgi:SAM-dependent methyltransferase
MDTVSIWNGRADEYDAVRPQPPEVLVDILTQFIEDERPRLVVDLGSGTGLSTGLWAERAHRVIGIEPNDEMRGVAQQRLQRQGFPNVEFHAGRSNHTGLEDGCVDIVTCSQSLHWMEPHSTFAEVGRILRHGGLFVAYDYDWPPTVGWEVEQAYEQLMERVQHIEQALGGLHEQGRWEKEGHLRRMRESGQFRFAKEILLHHVEEGDAARFVRLTASNYLAELKEQVGINDHEIGFDNFKAEVERFIGDQTLGFYFSYRVRMGIK